MKVNFMKKSTDAILPSYSREGDAALDLFALTKHYSKDGVITFNTGIAVEIPENYVGLLFPRSGIVKKPLTLANCVGVIDSNFRGFIEIVYKPDIITVENNGLKTSITRIELIHNTLNVGDRVGQLLIIPRPLIEPNEVPQLSNTNRGTNGFGSSGN